MRIRYRVNGVEATHAYVIALSNIALFTKVAVFMKITAHSSQEVFSTNLLTFTDDLYAMI